jgi:hypothetical protein
MTPGVGDTCRDICTVTRMPMPGDAEAVRAMKLHRIACGLFGGVVLVGVLWLCVR